MKKIKFRVTEECIGCRACVEVSPRHFEMNREGKAFVKVQPVTPEEVSSCREAKEACPVEAIEEIRDVEAPVRPVMGQDNVKEVLDRYPELKEVLIHLSPKFKRIQSPLLYQTLARFASFRDAANATGVSLCEILHVINRYLGIEESLVDKMPECISQAREEKLPAGTEITWQESQERYIYNEGSRDLLALKIRQLKPGENIVILSVERPDILIKVAHGMGMKFHLEEGKEYRLSVYNPATSGKRESSDWQHRKESFEVMDVRDMEVDPFSRIMEKAYSMKEDEGFTLVQRFEPFPIINMLRELGFESLTEKLDDNEFRIYFYKTRQKEEEVAERKGEVEIVLQSATPVAYPLILRMMQSDVIRRTFHIRELKVWKETEKHLNWIVNGKADISFSALITSSKLKDAGVKFPALVVWDNFVLLTRYPARDLKDVQGREIRLPLFSEAPPAKITRYLIRGKGLDPDQFHFIFGEPFGRPEEIFEDFVTGKADTVVLREPEASYALRVLRDRGEEVSEIPFNRIWNELNPGFGSFPNAGVMIKEEFLKDHPEESRIFLEELKKAVDWINTHRSEAAAMSSGPMSQPKDRLELFLERVNFEYVDGEAMRKKIRQYFEILIRHDILQAELDEKFWKMFE
jgi:NitT/TauT family transport system substrate-binding protein